MTALFRRGDDRLLGRGEKVIVAGLVAISGVSLAAEGCGLFIMLSLATGHMGPLSFGALFGAPNATGWPAVEVPIALGVALLVSRTVIAPVQNYYLQRLTQTVAWRVRNRVLGLAANLPAVHAGVIPSGELTGIVLEHGSRCARSISATITTIQATLAVLVAAALLVARDPGLVLAACAAALPGFAVYGVIMIRTSADTKRVVAANHHGAGVITEGLRSLASIKAVGGEVALRRSFDDATRELLESETQILRNTLKMQGITLVIPLIAATGAVLYAVYYRGATDLKTLTAMLLPAAAIGSRIATTASTIVESVYATSVQATSFEPVDALIARLRSLSPANARVLQGPTGARTGPLECVLLRDIGYRLPNGLWLFRHVDHKIAPGAPLTLRGKSGTGKSTLASLISGANEPTEGEVRHVFDGREERPRAERLNYLSQDPAIVAGSVRSNLLLGAEDEAEGAIEDPALVKALRTVDLWAEIEPKGGLESTVYEGGRNLSGGQIRRLGLARLLARDRAIWIFDEAVASLDVASATIVEKLIRSISARAATIVITHDPDFILPGGRDLHLTHAISEEATTEEGVAPRKLEVSA